MNNPYAHAYLAKSRDEVVVEYAPLVKRIATRLGARLPEGMSLDDIIQAGMIGLLDAIEKYETGHDAQFRTYAEFRIRGAMLDELRSCDWIPRSVRENAHKISHAHLDLVHSLGRMPTEQEMAQKLGISLGEYHELLMKSRAIPLVNIEDIHPQGEGDHGSFLEVLEDPFAKNPLDELSLREVAERLRVGIDALPEKEKMVLSLYYDEDLNLKEIGQVLGITESRVCQLRTQSVARLRSLLADSASSELLEKMLTKRES
ncbi:MAG: RNA polymerase sigma factor FliA [Deltaproteobacteria bacterium]|nr:RNA polymerase sigma factor FliA [Deltaproteobacteria bacterium]